MDALRKGTLSDTASTQIGGNHIIRFLEPHRRDAGVINFEAVAPHARHVAIEDGSIERIGGSSSVRVSITLLNLK